MKNTPAAFYALLVDEPSSAVCHAVDLAIDGPRAWRADPEGSVLDAPDFVFGHRARLGLE